MINSRTKGATFERGTTKQITKWAEIPFKRNTGMDTQYLGLVRGDIIPYYSNPKDIKEHPMTLIIECKNRENWELEDLLLNPNTSGISKWYEQAEKEAMDTLAYPFLIIKKRHHLPLCIFPLNLHYDYFQNSNTPNGSLLWIPTDSNKKIIMTISNFFSTYDYKKLEKIIKEKIKENK